MFKNIVVAVDGSDHAEQAVNIACDIARRYDASVHLVHSPQLDTVALAVGAGAYSLKPKPEEVQAAGKQVMDRALAEATANGITAQSVIGNGVPADEVLKCANAVGADLIVAGRRGLGAVSSLVLGSTSLKISHDAECAVLTVR